MLLFPGLCLSPWVTQTFKNSHSCSLLVFYNSSLSSVSQGVRFRNGADTGRAAEHHGQECGHCAQGTLGSGPRWVTS